MSLQDKIAAAKTEFDAIYAHPFLTTAQMDRLGLLGRRLYRLRTARVRAAYLAGGVV